MLLERRMFLSVTLTVAVGGGLQLLFSCKPHEGNETRAVVDLSSRFSDLASVRRVGREALEKLPGDTDIEALIAVVLPQRTPQQLREEIQEQYRRGETTELGAWPIALTEARIYALVALSNTRETARADGDTERGSQAK